MTPHYKIIEIGGKELVIFYPQFKGDDGYKIIDKDNRFPIELKNHAEYMSFLETLIEREQELKDGLTTLADLVDEMDMLARGPKGDTRFMWVKYADDDKGSGMSDNPDGKKYIGMAFNKDIETPSDEPSDYKWVKYVADYEGLEIGGRNLLRNSDFSNGMIGYEVYTSTSFDGTVSFEDGVIKITSASTAFGGFYVHWNYIPQTLKGQVYTVTIWAKGFGTMRIGQEGVSGGLTTVAINSDDYIQYSHTFTPNITSTNSFSFYVNSPTDGIYVDRVKLEKGNVATDWSPAIEDIYALIDDIDAKHVGLGNVQNYGIASQSQAENGTSNSAYMTPLRTKQAIEKLSPSYVIDTEIGDDYILKKFSDGTFELKGHTVITTEIETELPGIYRSSNLSLQDVLNDLLPANAKMVYSNAWLMDGYFNTWMATPGISNPITDNTIRFRLFSYSSRPSSDYFIGYEIAGTWS